MKGILFLLLPLFGIYVFIMLVGMTSEVFNLEYYELPPIIGSTFLVGTIAILFPIILRIHSRGGTSLNSHSFWRSLVYAESILLIGTMLMIIVAGILFGPGMSDLLADPDISGLRDFAFF